MKNLLNLILVVTTVSIADAQAIAAERSSCARMLPAGLVIHVEPDETIIAGRTDGPLLLTVKSDLRLFPQKPAIIPRGSKVFARTIESKEAGHFWGRARYRMVIDTILTPNQCEYALDGKVIEAGKYKVVKDTVIGNGHAGRDFILTIFPPTTLYQLIRLPARGPKLNLDRESTLGIRLLQPVGLQEPEDSHLTGIDAPSLSPQVTQKAIVSNPQMVAECPDMNQAPLRTPVSFGNGVMRPFRNRTRYVVTLWIGRDTTRLGPCSASMVVTPTGEFTVSASAAVLEAEGQHEIPLEIVVNPENTGWDVINRERVEPKAIATRVLP